MQEDLLQYIWRFQYFNSSALTVISGEPLQIIYPGNYNIHQGADFKEAKIKLNKTLWAGNIEIHINSSDWHLHKHSADVNYNNIILHVVWNCDTVVKDSNGNDLPTLELKDRISKLLLKKYEELMAASWFIPCERMIENVNSLTLINWKQRLVAERLISKAQKIVTILKQTNFHWEETFWWLIAENFGLKVNSDFFQHVAKSLPVSILAKHKNNLLQIEALLFGQAGLLAEDFTEKYPLMLQKEFIFYKKKYNLQSIDGNLLFLRMRPANFPTIRLAQLSVLIHESEHLFSKIKDAGTLKEIKQLLSVTANDYWHYHYVFDEESMYMEKKLGRQMIDNIIINTIVPVIFAYGLHHNEQRFKDKALQWLSELSAEKNSITKGFENLHLANESAFDSQAFIQLKNEYCNMKRCLKCAIGNFLLKRNI